MLLLMCARFVAAGLIALASLPGQAAALGEAATAQWPGTQVQPQKRTPTATLSLPGNVTEGDRYSVVVKLKAASQAKSLQLQQRSLDVFGDLQWSPVKTVRASGKRTHRFHQVAGESDTERFRAVVTSDSGKRLVSPAAEVTVWHWTELTAFSAYYETSASGTAPTRPSSR